MRQPGLFKKAASIGIACCGLMLLQGAVWGGQKEVVASPGKTGSNPKIIDVALGPESTIYGQVVDSQGIGVDGAVVVIRQEKGEVARTVTDKSGMYAVPNLRGGVYHITAGQGNALYRLWAPDTAPPSARTKALIVAGSSVVRGQAEILGMSAGTATSIGVSVASLGVAGFSMMETEDIQDELDAAIEMIESLPASP